MDKLFKKYLARHQVSKPVNGQLQQQDIRVVVPVFLEEDFIDTLLQSIKQAAVNLNKAIELILVVNYAHGASEPIKQRQQHLITDLLNQVDRYSDFFYLSIIKAFDLQAKHAGAGWARKIGMDYAISRFAEEENPKGVVVSLDADCQVQSNYFNELWSVFRNGPINGCTICFKHQTIGLSEEQKEAILQYELHLHYYLQVLRWTGHPYAYHTVGSCFAVTAEAYVRAGGMPRKQAGEDFYFLQKVIPLGHFKEVTSTCVYPSSRQSDRVPFGTGPTIAKLMKDSTEYLSYNLQAFIDLKAFFDIKEKLFKVSEENYLNIIHDLSGRIRSFLLNSGFFEDLKNINDNCASVTSFDKRFFEVFDAFKVVKYLNYTHTHFLERTPVFDVALDFLELIEVGTMDLLDTKAALDCFRKMERNKG